MKCVKVIKSSKNLEIGLIDRVDDSIAKMRVITGFWQYVPKAEWKNTSKNKETENVKNTGKNDIKKTKNKKQK